MYVDQKAIVLHSGPLAHEYSTNIWRQHLFIEAIASPSYGDSWKPGQPLSHDFDIYKRPVYNDTQREWMQTNVLPVLFKNNSSQNNGTKSIYDKVLHKHYSVDTHSHEKLHRKSHHQKKFVKVLNNLGEIILSTIMPWITLIKTH